MTRIKFLVDDNGKIEEYVCKEYKSEHTLSDILLRHSVHKDDWASINKGLIDVIKEKYIATIYTFTNNFSIEIGRD